METSTCGSELVALCIAIGALTEVRYKLRTMVIDFYKNLHVFCDKKYVVCNMQPPPISSKKKHNYVAYHKCREAVASGIVEIGHIGGKKT